MTPVAAFPSAAATTAPASSATCPPAAALGVQQHTAKSNGEFEDSKVKAGGPALLTPAPLGPALRAPAPQVPALLTPAPLVPALMAPAALGLALRVPAALGLALRAPAPPAPALRAPAPLVPALIAPAPLGPALGPTTPGFLPQDAPPLLRLPPFSAHGATSAVSGLKQQGPMTGPHAVKAEPDKFTGVTNPIAINALAGLTVQVSPYDTHAVDTML